MATVNLYEQVRDSLLGRIAAGEFKSGDKLPTEDELCKQYGVSRITVRRAVSELAAQMLIAPKRGVGTIVTERSADRRVFRLSGFFGNGTHFKVKKIDSGIEAAGQLVAKALRISEGVRVHHDVYVAIHKNEPYTLTDAYEVDSEEQAAPKKAAASLKRVARAEQELIAVISDAMCETHLGYPAGRPIMEARRLVIASDGSPIRYLILRYHPERYRFVVDMLPGRGLSIFEGQQNGTRLDQAMRA